MDDARALVHALCSTSVSCVPWRLLHASMLINVMLLILLRWLCTGMDEARALVDALYSSSVSHVLWPLLHASMLINILLYFDFITLVVHGHG